MKRKAGLLSVAFVLALSAGLAACGEKKEEGSTTVRLAEVTRSIFYAPQYVALSEGFFEEEGLKVEFQTIAGGDKVSTALLSGQIDVALVGAESTIYVRNQGADDPLINFAQLTQTDGTFLVSRKPVANFDWSSLKGVTFLGQRKGGMPQMAGEFTLKKKGINPQKDLNLIQNVDFANIPAAFTSGTGDYVQLFEPQATVIEKEGKGYVIASFGKESGKLPYTVFMSKKSYITKNSATVQKFTNAIHKAQKWVESKSVPEIAEAIISYFPNTDKAVVEGVVKRYKEQGSFATDPVIDEAEWKNLQDVMEAAGELKTRVPLADLVNNSFAEKAMK
jgi:NitT/TauT family transport system substrate-binding protein